MWHPAGPQLLRTVFRPMEHSATQRVKKRHAKANDHWRPRPRFCCRSCRRRLATNDRVKPIAKPFYEQFSSLFSSSSFSVGFPSLCNGSALVIRLPIPMMMLCKDTKEQIANRAALALIKRGHRKLQPSHLRLCTFAVSGSERSKLSITPNRAPQQPRHSLASPEPGKRKLRFH